MPREVIDQDGTTWTAAEAYQGLEGMESTSEASKVLDAGGHVHVVCTPGGGAQTVRLKLPPDWESALSDDALLEAIRSGRSS